MLEDPAVALTILVLALFVGIEVISKVPPLLHTPLMSGRPQASSARQISAAPAMPLSSPVSSTGLCCGAQQMIGSLRWRMVLISI